MTDNKAKYILHEIKSIQRYECIIREIENDLKEINQQIKTVQEPSSPSGKSGPKIENHKDKSSIVNALLSDEMQIINEQKEFKERKAKAEYYLASLKLVCDASELTFIDAFFFRHYSYEKLTIVYGYENPYKKVIDLIKKVEKS